MENHHLTQNRIENTERTGIRVVLRAAGETALRSGTVGRRESGRMMSMFTDDATTRASGTFRLSVPTEYLVKT